MPLLVARELSKAFGTSPVLAGASFSLEAGERVGLVGRNGAGKSTLGRILAGVEVPDLGEVSTNRGARVEYLAQEPELDPALTVRAAVLGGLGGWSRAHAAHAAVSEKIAQAEGALDELLAEQARAGDELERLGGWDIAHRAEAFMQRLAVPPGDRLLATLSGGEQRRVALARLLTAQPDLAILDEPTNHLDAETIEWLEEHLANDFPGALLLITHDRWVLDRVVTRTVEIEGGALHSYPGGWGGYLEAKAEREAISARTEHNRQRFLSRELEWLRRQPKARSGKQKARIDRIGDAVQVEAPTTHKDVELGMKASRLGSSILELRGLTLDIAGRRLIDDLTLSVTRGQRIGILGANGSGKTSLLRALLGQLSEEQGEVLGGSIVRGKNTNMCYFDQGRSGLDEEASILENVSDGRASVEWRGQSVSVYTYLDRLRFPRDRILSPVAQLSGGERARVALAKLLLGEANVLVLDEPTNDLDVHTLGALEELLVEFAGVTLVVTHDRYFLDRVATDILHFEGDGKVTHYVGNYQTFSSLSRAAKAGRTKARAADTDQAVSAKPAGSPRKPKKLGYKDQRELDALPDKIAAREGDVARLEAELADPGTYSDRAAAVPALVEELERQRAELDRMVNRWEELELILEASEL